MYVPQSNPPNDEKYNNLLFHYVYAHQSKNFITCKANKGACEYPENGYKGSMLPS